MIRQITYTQAINEALDMAMQRDKSVFVIGEGVPDPKGIFGSTLGLKEKYPDRIFDMPISENGMTGVCIGAATTGMRPVLLHQRIDFSLLSMDQIVNNAAKWKFMFGDHAKCPLLIRMIIGRGWGQGPQHSQSLQALFAHIPGLKVIMPVTPTDAKGMILASLDQSDPVICIEHRWLYNLKGEVPKGYYKKTLNRARIARIGNDITLAATSYMVIEAIKAADFLKTKGVSVEVIDLRTINKIDKKTLLNSVRKTKNLVVCDSGHKSCGVAAEVIALVSENYLCSMNSISRVTTPDSPPPTSPKLTKKYYPTYKDIVNQVSINLGSNRKYKFPKSKIPHDVPDNTFEGPF